MLGAAGGLLCLYGTFRRLGNIHQNYLLSQARKTRSPGNVPSPSKKIMLPATKASVAVMSTQFGKSPVKLVTRELQSVSNISSNQNSQKRKALLPDEPPRKAAKVRCPPCPYAL